MAVTRQQVKQILKSHLSGRETAKLILQDAWEKDHEREGFLTDEDIQRLKKGLRVSQDIDAYNSLIELYRIMSFTLQGIRISALETVGILEQANKLLKDCYLRSILRDERPLDPVIMTEKQYEDVKARQRQELLQEIHEFGQALAMRAYAEAPREQQKESGYDFWGLVYDRPDLLSLAVSQYQEQIQSGGLRPVILTEEQIQRVQEIDGQLEEARESWRAGPPDEYRENWLDWYREHFPEDTFDKDQEQLERELRHAYSKADMDRLSERYRAKEALQSKAHQEGLKAWGQEQAQRLLEGLELLKAHPEMVDTEEHPGLDWLLSWTYISGQQLYQTGFPEHVQWIDEYKPGLSEADPFENKVAIILNPSKFDLDEQGHYKTASPWERIERYLAVTVAEEQLQEQGSNLTELLQDFTTAARARIRDFLASQAVTEAVSKATDIPFTEDTERDFEHIQNMVKQFNLLAKEQPLLPHLPDGLILPEIRIARMRPKQEMIQHLRERVAMALGEDWWRELKDIELAFEDEPDEEEA